MRRRWLFLLLCLAVCLGLSYIVVATAANALRVNETATRILLAEGQTKVSLACENDTGRALPAHIKLELLDTQNKLVAQAEHEETIKTGTSNLVAYLPFATSALKENERKQLLWYRLRYRITPNAQEGASAPVEGIVSLSEITPDLFELRVAAARNGREGQPYRVRVRATHPVTSRPVKGVEVNAEISFGDEKTNLPLKASGTTNADGFATLDFNLPRHIKDDELDLKVMGRRGDVVQEASDNINLDHSLRFLISTDKPLYQPGQILHVRALLLDASRHAAADTPATLKIKDPDEELIFHADLKTTRFGIASADWSIPENTRLGDYQIEVAAENAESDQTAQQFVKISRYDLPNFSVNVAPDRNYYLPGENATVEVRGDYLFGQSVKRGHVRIVRETERHWNYKEQKYDIEETDKYEGELDKDGRFRARINLAPEHAKLAEETYTRFNDLSYAAYLTDPTTNRTEQRRFTLRVTRDAIHIYITQGNNTQVAGLPLEFFVSTSYADGTPAAACEVQIGQEFVNTIKRAGSDMLETQTRIEPLRTIKMNRLGVAKIVGPVVSRDETREVSLIFNAHDREGRTGEHTEQFWLQSGPAMRIETDKAIYREGEPIEAEIKSDQPDMKVFVEVASENRVVHSEAMRLHNGHAHLTVPYQTEMQNQVTLVAYTTDIPESAYDDYASGTHTVIYPRNRELNFDLHLSRASYKPGEEAQASFRVRTTDGRAAESALGIVVFDKAVEERARTDQESNSAYGFYDNFRYFWYGPDQIGGYTLRDLVRLDLSKTLPDGLDTVAELLLQRDDGGYRPNFFGGASYETNQPRIFAKLVETELKPMRDVLTKFYLKNSVYPTDEKSLREVLAAAGVSLADVRDPWGTPYRAVFTVERDSDILTLMSAGADKRFETADDWAADKFSWPYFRPQGERVSRVVADYHARTGGFVRDAATLKSELSKAGFDFDTLRDHWGKPYEVRFEISNTSYTIKIWSGGPDARFEPANNYSSDDFSVWTTWTDYFAETRAAIDNALAAHFKSTHTFPKDEAGLREVLRHSIVNLDELRDAWGHRYYVTFRTDARYADQVRVESRTDNQSGQAKQHTDVKPVTQTLNIISVCSAGPDGKIGTSDDFTAGEFSSIYAELAASAREPQITQAMTSFSGATGAIQGTVTDPQGAVVPNATVTATHKNAESLSFKTQTMDDGTFLLRNLPSGMYDVRVDAQAFKTAIIQSVWVNSSTLTNINVQLEIGAVTETVEVTAGASLELSTTSASVSSVVKKEFSSAQKPPIATPRLRKDFPETLVWQPALETDKHGRAELKFKLADNITTWKMSIIGSTADGEIGTVEKEFRAFQPFFVEHDPPRVLTVGDEISLPVVVRNYLDKSQTVALDIKPESWFTLISLARQQTNVAAGDATRAVFDFRADASIKDGMQRITANAADANDAIEKSVSVHPDGQEIAETTEQIIGGNNDNASLEVSVPAETIPQTAHAELKIYPNLMSHVIESVEAILARPYGCGEQTISSTYPSLMALRYYKRAGLTDAQLPPTATKARRYLQLGYERLLNYREADGGFSYWGHGDSDVALTAYAIRFLEDAREFINIDADVLANARDYLIKQQQSDGSWHARYWTQTDRSPQSALLTAYIARVLANDKTAQDAMKKLSIPADKSPGKTQSLNGKMTPLRRALDYLAHRTDELDEPYLIASYALAALDSGGDASKIEKAMQKLHTLAHQESRGTYWSLETNTPFYGWGLTGRIETTALVVQALARAAEKQGWGDAVMERRSEEQKGESRQQKPLAGDSISTPIASSPYRPIAPSLPSLIEGGLLFLLRNKDRYGVWLSTQATINVLDALVLLSNTNDGAAVGAQEHAVAAGDQMEIFVNGTSAGTVTLPADHRPAAPLMLDLSRFIAAGANRVEIKHAGVLPKAAAQVVATYYVPWPHTGADGHHASPNASSALRLAVDFDKTKALTGETVSCRVEAERIGFHGYGMMLAEIGLPPGADVDRASLERAMKESAWEFSHYDVLPDRLIVYLWPRAGGSRFTFNFRPRFGLNAQSAPSVLYDYYNPEARAVLAPTRFNFRDASSPPATVQAKKE